MGSFPATVQRAVVNPRDSPTSGGLDMFSICFLSTGFHVWPLYDVQWWIRAIRSLLVGWTCFHLLLCFVLLNSLLRLHLWL